ncbi:hypothetical protein INT48_007845 [Thamnidium elegans]|uniref:CS domain-containing protein n=1 Tax=Thamnidium elegans TaxID=101142 RepID=A0A8H7VXW9_9FUNG|nr:hypothetical protein INT48_007845 [Thamnidium elegans]
MSEHHYQELYRLKSLTSLPSVQNVLDNLINERQVIREPIKRSKAQIQTLYITTGYAWGQSLTTVTLYVNFEGASELPKDKYSVKVLQRSLELNIYENKGANYNFKINQLCDFVVPEKTVLKKNKILIVLCKQNQDSDWPDLRMKTTQNTYNELERFEKTYEPIHQDNFQTPFIDSSGTCIHNT